MSLNFFPSGTTEAEREKTFSDPKVSAALVELGLQLKLFRGNPTEKVQHGLASRRKLVIKTLKAVPDFSEEGKLILEELGNY